MTDNAHASGAGRKLGNGFSLALKTGGDPGTHMTLVYLTSCKRGYEQSRAREIADAYFQQAGITSVDFDLGAVYNERSRLVVSAQVAKISADLRGLLQDSFSIDPNQVLHIDLRGNAVSAIQTKNVSVVDNWLYLSD